MQFPLASEFYSEPQRNVININCSRNTLGAAEIKKKKGFLLHFNSRNNLFL